MRLVEVPLVRRNVEDSWPLVGDHVPLGKRYVVDLDRDRVCTLLNKDTQRRIQVRCLWVVSPEPAGWLPVMAFGLADVERRPGEPR